jgi:DNA primase
MALISEESLERVKQAADIVEIVSAHTDLRRQGARWVGLCPFHEERTPSFSVDAQEKLYHCFGCGVGGDTIKFVEEKEGLGFAEAVELLAERYGVELQREKEDPRAEARRQQRRRLGELLDRTASFYVHFLWEAEEAGKARAYLAERGLGEETLRAFGVGYAPSAWDTVLLRGQRVGFKVEELRAVGLAQRGRSGGEYDRFRERIMFPIRDRRGHTLGFGGRAMRSDQGAKYVNTAETDFFHKSEMLYGIDLAKEAIAKSGRVVVVEGYTDVLALHQAGIGEAVGVMGTAITEEQVAALSGMVDEVVLALDADSAGQEAMLRAQRVAAGRKMRLRVAAMPAGEDPAEMMVAEGGAERFRALVEGAVDLPAFQVGLVLERTDVSSPAERDRALEEVAPILAGMGESHVASREELERRVADRLDLDPPHVQSRVVAARPLSGGGTRTTPPARPQAGSGQRQRKAPVPSPAALTSRERRERALLAMCIALPSEGREYLARLTDEHLSPAGARAAAWLREHPEDPASNLPMDDDELAGLITELIILASNEPASPEAKNEPASPEAMELNYLLLEQRRLESQIAAAGEADDYERRAALSRERAALVERIARAERVGG